MPKTPLQGQLKATPIHRIPITSPALGGLRFVAAIGSIGFYALISCGILISYGLGLCAHAHASEPLHWNRVPTKPAPAQFDTYHGETLDFSCTFRGFGSPLFAGNAAPCLYYQTNGMGKAWWPLPATVTISTNSCGVWGDSPVSLTNYILSATFPPSADPGAERLSVFFGAPSNAYAAAQVRFLNSPGAHPNILDPPSLLDWMAELSALSNNLARAIANAAPADYANVSNRAMSALQEHQSLEPSTNYTDTAIAALPHITTNDVCAIVTNTVDDWTYEGLPTGAVVTMPPKYVAGQGFPWEFLFSVGSTNYAGINFTDDGSLTPVVFDCYDIDSSSIYFDVTATRITRNTLGLARLSDLPTNHVTQAELEAAIDAIPVPEIDTSKLATKQQLQAVSNEAQVVYRLFSGSNVVAEVTNYNSQVNAPQLRLLQLNESNEYFTVWSETNGLTRTLNSANTHTDSATNDLATSCALTYAPRAWSRTTSGLGADAPPNTTWLSTPTTVIAGGLEYAKVVHANGAVWVLSGNGMMNFDPTTNAYLRISADDGTEIFSIEKTDAVTVGAYAEGITVSGNVITIPVPVVSADHPTMYWRESLESGGWADESEINSRLGGGYEWTGSSGAWVCTAWVTDGLPPSMFFKCTYEQEGSTVIKNGAAVDVSGGIMCTDGIHKCRPVYNNGSITWEVVP